MFQWFDMERGTLSQKKTKNENINENGRTRVRQQWTAAADRPTDWMRLLISQRLQLQQYNIETILIDHIVCLSIWARKIENRIQHLCVERRRKEKKTHKNRIRLSNYTVLCAVCTDKNRRECAVRTERQNGKAHTKFVIFILGCIVFGIFIINRLSNMRWLEHHAAVGKCGCAAANVRPY